jgi:hypothetical protein
MQIQEITRTKTELGLYMPSKDGKAPYFIEPLDLMPDGSFLTRFGDKTVSQMRVHYGPDMKIGTLDEYVELEEAHYRTDPVEITEEQYMNALNILPPVGFAKVDGVESFKFLEATCGRITTIFAQVGKRFFKFDDVCNMPASKIAERINALVSKEGVRA